MPPAPHIAPGWRATKTNSAPAGSPHPHRHRGTTSQPSRQPVIWKYLEKLFTTKYHHSPPARCAHHRHRSGHDTARPPITPLPCTHRLMQLLQCIRGAPARRWAGRLAIMAATVLADQWRAISSACTDSHCRHSPGYSPARRSPGSPDAGCMGRWGSGNNTCSPGFTSAASASCSAPDAPGVTTMRRAGTSTP